MQFFSNKSVKRDSILYTLFLAMFLAGLIGILSASAPVSMGNILYLVIRDPYIYLIAVGCSLLITAGYIDMSITGQIALYTVIIGRLTEMGAEILVIIIALLVSAMICAAINAGIVILMKISPFIITLATQLLFKGLSAVLMPKEGYIPSLPYSFRMAMRRNLLGLPVDCWIGIIGIVSVTFIFAHTVLGLKIKATGANEQIARKSGVDTSTVKIITYQICSFFIAISVLSYNARLGSMSATSIGGYELAPIIAVFLSGASYLHPGKIDAAQYALRLAMSIAIIELLENGMIFLGFASNMRILLESVVFLTCLFIGSRRKENNIKDIVHPRIIMNGSHESKEEK